MTEPLTVQLPEEASDQLKQQIVAMLNEAVEHVSRQVDRGEFVKGYAGAASYLGCGRDAIKVMTLQGLPTHTVQALPKVLFFSKAELNRYVLHDGQL